MAMPIKWVLNLVCIGGVFGVTVVDQIVPFIVQLDRTCTVSKVDLMFGVVYRH